MQHAIEEIVVLGHRAPVGTHAFELGDVRPGRECLASRAAKHDAAHFRVALELLHRRRDRAPHGVADGIFLRRLVEDEPADGAALVDPQRHGLPDGP